MLLYVLAVDCWRRRVKSCDSVRAQMHGHMLFRLVTFLTLTGLIGTSWAQAQDVPQPSRAIVLVLDTGSTWGGDSTPTCLASDSSGCVYWGSTVTASRFGELKSALAETVKNENFVPRDGSMTIAVVQATGADLPVGGTRDWTQGPRVEIDFTQVNDEQDAIDLANRIEMINRFAVGSFTNCTPSEALEEPRQVRVVRDQGGQRLPGSGTHQ